MPELLPALEMLGSEMSGEDGAAATEKRPQLLLLDADEGCETRTEKSAGEHSHLASKLSRVGSKETKSSSSASDSTTVVAAAPADGTGRDGGSPGHEMRVVHDDHYQDQRAVAD